MSSLNILYCILCSVFVGLGSICAEEITYNKFSSYKAKSYQKQFLKIIETIDADHKKAVDKLKDKIAELEVEKVKVTVKEMDSYRKKLEKELKSVLKKADLDEGNKINSELELLKTYEHALINDKKIVIKKAENRSGSKQSKGENFVMEGTWLIKYTNGASRTYVINKDQTVHFVNKNRDSKLQKTENEITLGFDDGKLEVLTLSGDKLKIKHYNPESSYPDGKPAVTGIGSRK